MKAKIVTNGKYFVIQRKVLFWWVDTGFPTYNSKEDAQRIIDKYFGEFKDCE